MSHKLKRGESINLSSITTQANTFVIHIKWQQK